jgi:sulfur carrier protein
MEDVQDAESRQQMTCARHVHSWRNWDCDKMSFLLKYKSLSEEREIPHENYTINDLLNEMELSPQTIVSKQNGELVIEDTVINEDDEIQLVQIIYGG